MTNPHLSPAEAQDEFWQHVKNGTTVMLGAHKLDSHLQPMTTFEEKENGLIWFFTRDDTDFYAEVARHPQCRMVLISKDHDVQADVRGICQFQRDQHRIDKFWNPMVAAWYPEGKSDPRLTLLSFRPQEAQIWVSTKGLIRLAFEVVKANVTKEKPDAGGVTELKFAPPPR
jgi:general stress protein 26